MSERHEPWCDSQLGPDFEALPHADRLMSLGVTQSGQPRHPLMLRSDTPLNPWPTTPTPPAVVEPEPEEAK